MTSYQRLRAITSSRVETSLRMVLCALIDHMSDHQDVCWPSVERIAQGAGLCERQARELLNDAEKRGIIRRWFGEHKSRDITIDWSALAQAPASVSARGGSRKAAKTSGEAAKTAAQPAKTAPVDTGKDCHPNRQSLPPQPAKTATPTGKDCPRSLPVKSTSEAYQEANQGAPAPAVAPRAPRKPDDAAALHAVYRGHRPRVSATPTPDTLKALKHILAECGKLDDAALYFAWVFQSQDTHARQLRGEAPWPNNGGHQARVDVVSLSRHIPSRLASAQAWDARGRRDAPEVVTFAHPQPRAQVPKTEGLLRHLHQRFLESSNAE